MTGRTGTNAAGTEEAVAALYRFMQDMLVWEQKWDAIFKSDGIHTSVPKASQELSEIYSRHLTQELMERDRKDGRLRSCAVGLPRNTAGTGKRWNARNCPGGQGADHNLVASSYIGRSTTKQPLHHGAKGRRMAPRQERAIPEDRGQMSKGHLVNCGNPRGRTSGKVR